MPERHTIDDADFEKLAGRFAELFSSLTKEGIADQVRDVYAADAYLYDTLKEVRGVDSICDYLTESGEAVQSCEVQLNDLARSQRDYYVRWTMQIRFKKLNKGRICRSEGISHLRFNRDGKISFHQDYWDSASGLFEHIPVVGLLIRLVKKRL
jgi:hypothetical protein